SQRTGISWSMKQRMGNRRSDRGAGPANAALVEPAEESLVWVAGPVQVSNGTAKDEDTAVTLEKAVKPPRRRRLFLLWLFIFGTVSLSYLLGAAVIYFELPSSGFLNKAFVGARAWYDRRQTSSQT